MDEVVRKSTGKRIFLCFFSLMVCFAPITGFSKTVSLDLAYSDVEAFPSQMGEGTQVADPPGIAIDIIQRAFDDLGLELNLYRYPNKRVQYYLKQSKVDGAFVFSYKKGREILGVYPRLEGQLDKTRRVFEFSYHLYVLERTHTAQELFQSKDPTLKIGVNRGYSIGGDLRSQGYQVDEANSTSTNFKKLLAGRVNALALQSVSADAYLKANNIKGIKKITPAIKTKDYYLVISHELYSREPALVEQLWSRIGSLREDITRSKAIDYLTPTE